jgi:very-short-patch-repair endonuclease
MENNNEFYNKKNKTFARELRNNSTKSEIKLWTELLRTKKMMGYSFLRQRPIGYYIADFLCKELKLIIEVDSLSHEGKEGYDKRRDKMLLDLGFTTLRFTDEDILNDLNFAEYAIKEWINKKVGALGENIPLTP